MEAFDISVEGFSGPLDLLCSLVESRQMEASRIKVRQLVRIYGVYLARTKRASVETIAEFFYMAAGLLLSKTRSLLPGAEPGPEEEIEVDEEALMETLVRYRPYRVASHWLWGRLEEQSRCFRRPAQGTAEAGGEEALDLEYDVGDLYFLARVWWGVFERHNRERSRERERLLEEEAADWDGFAEAAPDEALIEDRIAELDGRLAREGTLFLSALCRAAHSVKLLVVTLLALLEMCRMGRVRIEQEELFADVKVLAEPAA